MVGLRRLEGLGFLGAASAFNLEQYRIRISVWGVGTSTL